VIDFIHLVTKFSIIISWFSCSAKGGKHDIKYVDKIILKP